MPAKRCIETKNMCLLFVDYCKKLSIPKRKRKIGYSEGKKLSYTQKKKGNWVQRGKKAFYTQKKASELGIARRKSFLYPKEKGKWGRKKGYRIWFSLRADMKKNWMR